MSIRRVNRGKSHSYVDDAGARIPGVTTIIGDGIPKRALIDWAARATAEHAVDHWDELATQPPSARLKTLTGARYAVSDAAARRGTQVHALAERLVRGESVTVPDEITGHVESYVSFLDEFGVQPIVVEGLIWSRTHGYCGTLDLIASLVDPDDPQPDPTQRRRNIWLLDIKTNRSGVYGETALQLAAYRYADVLIDDDGEHDMPIVERTGVVHVRPDGYDLVPVEAGETQHRQFLYAQQIADFCSSSRELVGAPITRPTASVYRLIKEEPW